MLKVMLAITVGHLNSGGWDYSTSYLEYPSMEECLDAEPAIRKGVQDRFVKWRTEHPRRKSLGVDISLECMRAR